MKFSHPFRLTSQFDKLYTHWIANLHALAQLRDTFLTSPKMFRPLFHHCTHPGLFPTRVQGRSTSRNGNRPGRESQIEKINTFPIGHRLRSRLARVRLADARIHKTLPILESRPGQPFPTLSPFRRSSQLASRIPSWLRFRSQVSN